MSAVKILTPTPKMGGLKHTNPFNPDDVLYKIVEGRKCNYLVKAISGETRMLLIAYDESGSLSKQRFVIDRREASQYKIDVLATRLRKTCYELKSKTHE